jgi:hypothetical protein
MNLGELVDKWSLEKIRECVEQIPWDHEMVYMTVLNILNDAEKSTEFDEEDAALKIANHARELWLKKSILS